MWKSTLCMSALLVACGSSGARGFAGATDAAAAPAEEPGAAADDTDAAIASSNTASDSAQKCEDSVDVVFVLDVSSSMSFVLQKLSKEIDQVIVASNKLGRGDAHFGLVAFVDNAHMDTTGPLEGGKVHTSGGTLRPAFSTYETTYTDPNRNPGDGPTGPTTQNPICEENSLDALHLVATEFPWREKSSRVVILVTDDTFLERPDNYGDRDGDGKTDKTDFPREGNYPALFTVAETVQALRDKSARVFSFTRLKEPGAMDLSRCGTGRRLPWSSVSDGWSTPYEGQEPIPKVTSGKNFDVELVRAGTLSLAATINEVVLQSYCNPPK